MRLCVLESATLPAVSLLVPVPVPDGGGGGGTVCFGVEGLLDWGSTYTWDGLHDCRGFLLRYSTAETPQASSYEDEAEMIDAGGGYIVESRTVGPFDSPRNARSVRGNRCRGMLMPSDAPPAEEKRPPACLWKGSDPLVWKGNVVLGTSGSKNVPGCVMGEVKGINLNSKKDGTKGREREEKKTRPQAMRGGSKCERSLPREGNVPCCLVRLGEIAN